MKNQFLSYLGVRVKTQNLTRSLMLSILTASCTALLSSDRAVTSPKFSFQQDLDACNKAIAEAQAAEQRARAIQQSAHCAATGTTVRSKMQHDALQELYVKLLEAQNANLKFKVSILKAEAVTLMWQTSSAGHQ